MRIKQFWHLLKAAASAWSDDNAQTHGAALAYYTAFSLAPLLLIAISMTAVLVGEDNAQSAVGSEIRRTLGPLPADAASKILENAQDSGGNTHITLIGLVMLVVGASGVFIQLQDALNIIWKTEAPPRIGNVVMHFIRHRLLSFAAVVGTGFLLLVSFVVSTMLTALAQWLTTFPGSSLLWQALAALLSLGLIALLFALIFKLLPDAPIAWGDVWQGSLLTAVLFTLGQQLIAFYMAHAGIASAHGAAGSLVVALVWVYYASQIVLFGAEFTHVYAQGHGVAASAMGQPGRMPV
ncbi:MAG TPA: YihY/virulence factor BrkB family protein [Gemmataceae bacterium]|nr:YihY/virulence factor BrkB family protein [Gemmataceae bacterium]